MENSLRGPGGRRRAPAYRRRLAVELPDIVEAVTAPGAAAGRLAPALGPPPHGDVQLDERLVIAGRGVDQAAVLGGAAGG